MEALRVSQILERGYRAWKRVSLRQMRFALSIWVDAVAAEARSELTRGFEKRAKSAAHVAGAKIVAMWTRGKQQRAVLHALRQWQRFVVVQKDQASVAKLQQTVLMSFSRLLVRAGRKRQLHKVKSAWQIWKHVLAAHHRRMQRSEEQDRQLSHVSVKYRLVEPSIVTSVYISYDCYCHHFYV